MTRASRKSLRRPTIARRQARWSAITGPSRNQSINTIRRAAAKTTSRHLVGRFGAELARARLFSFVACDNHHRYGRPLAILSTCGRKTAIHYPKLGPVASRAGPFFRPGGIRVSARRQRGSFTSLRKRRGSQLAAACAVRVATLDGAASRASAERRALGPRSPFSYSIAARRAFVWRYRRLKREPADDSSKSSNRGRPLMR